MSLRPHKGERVPTLDGGPTRGGMDLQVNSILLANPFHRPWRQHLRVAFHTKASKSASVFAKPSLKRAVTDTSRVCKFVFVCAFHGIFLFTKVRKIIEICKGNREKNQNNFTVSGHIWSKVFNALFNCRTFAVD